MLTSRLNSIPRFALPYTRADFMAGGAGDLSRRSASGGVRTARRQPQILDPQRQAGASSAARSARPQAGIGGGAPLISDPSLVGAIVAAGHRPVFIDIDRRYLTMDPKSLDAARGAFAAIVVALWLGKWRTCPLSGRSPGYPLDRRCGPCAAQLLGRTTGGRFWGGQLLQLCLHQVLAGGRRRDRRRE